MWQIFILKESVNSGALHSCKRCIEILIQLWIKQWNCLLLDKFTWRGIFFRLFRNSEEFSEFLTIAELQNLKLQLWLALSNGIWLEVLSAQSWLEVLIRHICEGWNCQFICSLLEIVLSFCFHHIGILQLYLPEVQLHHATTWMVHERSF